MKKKMLDVNWNVKNFILTDNNQRFTIYYAKKCIYIYFFFQKAQIIEIFPFNLMKTKFDDFFFRKKAILRMWNWSGPMVKFAKLTEQFCSGIVRNSGWSPPNSPVVIVTEQIAEVVNEIQIWCLCLCRILPQAQLCHFWNFCTLDGLISRMFKSMKKWWNWANIWDLPFRLPDLVWVKKNFQIFLLQNPHQKDLQ